MIKAVTKEFKILALMDSLKWLTHVESCYSKIVKLLDEDSFPLSPNLSPPEFCLAREGGSGQQALGPHLLFSNNTFYYQNTQFLSNLIWIFLLKTWISNDNQK